MKKVIKKVLDELAKEKPDLSYMRGLLEGLVDDDESRLDQLKDMKLDVLRNGIIGNTLIPPTTPMLVDEASILDNMTRAAIERNPNILKPIE